MLPTVLFMFPTVLLIVLPTVLVTCNMNTYTSSTVGDILGTVGDGWQSIVPWVIINSTVGDAWSVPWVQCYPRYFYVTHGTFMLPTVLFMLPTVPLMCYPRYLIHSNRIHDHWVPCMTPEVPWVASVKYRGWQQIRCSPRYCYPRYFFVPHGT